MTLDEYRATQPKPRRKNRSDEFVLTMRIADMLKVEAPPSLLWTHFPAGEARDERTGAKLKAMGLKPGWPDFLFVLPGGRLGAIEVKTEAGRLSDTQKRWATDARGAGAAWAECRTVGGVREALRGWGVAMKGVGT